MTKLGKTGLLASAAAALIVQAGAAGASGTPAGTTITNIAQVSYRVGSTDQSPLQVSNTITVDRKVNLVLAPADTATAAVTPGQQKAVSAFILSNISNSSLDFSLAASQLTGGTAAHGGIDSIDLSGLAVVVDANGNGTYEPLVDIATYVDELAADSSVKILVIGDVPSTALGGQVAGITLAATARESGTSGAMGAVVTASPTNTVGVDTVLADGAGTNDSNHDGTFSAAGDYTVANQPIDLSVAISSSNTSPVSGFDQYTVNVSVTNAGPANASGIAVNAPIPAGVGLISETSAGGWNSGTGIWTVGALGIGETKTFSYTVIAASEGTANVTARVSAADQADSDSSPASDFATDDLGDSLPDDDEASIAVITQRSAGTITPQTCPVGLSTFDWSTQTWTATSMTGSYNVAGKPISISVSDTGNSLITTSPYFTPSNAAYYKGGLASIDNALNFAARDATLAPDGISITMQLGPAGVGVENLRFKLFDIDGNPTYSRIEGVTIAATFGGVPVSPMLAGGSAISIQGNQARGIQDSSTTGNSSGNGTLQVGFSGRVDQVTIKWGNAPGTTSTTGVPGFGLHDLVFCTPPTGISVTKSSTPFDPANPFAVPGSDVIYAITFTNIGEVPIDPDSIVLIDAMPNQMTFYNGDYDGSGPGTGPVGFAQTGNGLSFTYGADVRYASGTTPPSSFGACNYAPTAAYDPNVRFICINPKGAMEATDPDATATIRFRAQIK